MKRTTTVADIRNLAKYLNNLTKNVDDDTILYIDLNAELAKIEMKSNFS